MLHQIKAQQFYTALDPYQQCWVLQTINQFKDFSRPLSDFPELFKADLIFKNFSSKPSKFQYFSKAVVPYVICTTFNALALQVYEHLLLKQYKNNPHSP